eukprot:14167168-Alexandrium_andersonii.AAC.1
MWPGGEGDIMHARAVLVQVLSVLVGASAIKVLLQGVLACARTHLALHTSALATAAQTQAHTRASAESCCGACSSSTDTSTYTREHRHKHIHARGGE